MYQCVPAPWTGQRTAGLNLPRGQHEDNKARGNHPLIAALSSTWAESWATSDPPHNGWRWSREPGNGSRPREPNEASGSASDSAREQESRAGAYDDTPLLVKAPLVVGYRNLPSEVFGRLAEAWGVFLGQERFH